jgi:hypothetical protein
MILNWEEYHDDVTEMDYELPHFTMEGYKTQDEFYHKNNLSVHSTIFSCIEFAILNKLQQVPCFILDGFVMTVGTKFFPEKLENCLLFFEQMEMYEQCAEVMKLKALL